jgi:hypothetical protein
MKRAGLAALALASVLAGCVRTSEGVPVASKADPGAAAPSATAGPPRPGEQSSLGVAPTTRTPVPPNTVACSQPLKPSVRMTAEVDDPRAPRVTVGVPDKWSMTAGAGDVGGRLDGPGGMAATISIAATQLDPAAAFRKYTDDLMAESPVSTVSVLPGELCGYSGQKLMGAWSETPQNAVDYEDRIVHIWTDSAINYLVAVHVEAPTGTPGFDSAAALLTEDFEIVLP